ncbi:MAG: xanthine dehydrogenase family protein subunit M [bacterium]|nr:xanthine dehydrogenase family protein subunit M [bacterium]
MKKFKYKKASSLEEASALLKSENNSKVIAGGTDILVQIKDRVKLPEVLVDLSYIESLKTIKEEGEYIEIGSLATHSRIATEAVVLNHAKVLAMASLSIGSPQIRNRGTIGGNIMNASPAGDMIPALFVLDAELVYFTGTEFKAIPIINFFEGPGRTKLQSTDILTSVKFKKHSGWHGYFHKIASRNALAISKLSFAGMMKVKENVITNARFAYGAVGPKVIKGNILEKEVIGKNKKELDLKAIEEAVKKEITPISDLRSTAEYRKEITAIITRRIFESSKP